MTHDRPRTSGPAKQALAICSRYRFGLFGRLLEHELDLLVVADVDRDLAAGNQVAEQQFLGERQSLGGRSTATRGGRNASVGLRLPVEPVGAGR